MFSLNQRGASGYAKVSVETGVLTASPVKLIIMLYDGAIVACQGAVGCMQRKDILNKGTMLTKAILIIEWSDYDSGIRSFGHAPSLPLTETMLTLHKDKNHGRQ